MKNPVEAVQAADPIALQEISQNTIYLMGTSFVLGSLFTIFVLILLDFMKRDRVPRQPD